MTKWAEQIRKGGKWVLSEASLATIMCPADVERCKQPAVRVHAFDGLIVNVKREPPDYYIVEEAW